MDKEILDRAKEHAETEAGGSDELSEHDRELLDIGVRCGIAATMDVLRRRLR